MIIVHLFLAVIFPIFFGKYACNQMYDLRQNFLDQYFERLDKIHLIYLHSILNFK